MAAEVAKRNVRFTECSLWIGLSTRIRKATAALAQATWQTIFARRELARLADLDDRMLADIGLTRGDLLVAGSAPLWHNPTGILEQRVGSRQAAISRAIQQSDELTPQFDKQGPRSVQRCDGALRCKDPGGRNSEPIGGSHAQARLCGQGETEPCEYIQISNECCRSERH